jgi:AraC-like DNA-binding protein
MTDGQFLEESGQGRSALGSVSAAYVQALLDTAVTQGAGREALLTRSGISSEQLADPGWRLRVDGLLQLFDIARELSGDELIGLHMGRQVRPRTFSALGYAAMSCRVLGEAVAMIPRYESLVYDGGTTTVDSADGRVRLAWRSGLEDHARMRPINEAIVAGWLSFGRWISGIRGELAEVHFQHSPPASLTEHESFFGCPIRFNAPDNALCFDARLLATPLIQHDDQLRGLMEQRAEEQVRQVRGAALTPRVIDAVRRCLPQGAPTATGVASALGLSERTLRRRLEAEGNSFGELMTQLRRELALHYLADRELGLIEIALLLGYGEQSSFSAAFKNWMGLPPGEYRLRQLNKQS